MIPKNMERYKFYALRQRNAKQPDFHLGTFKKCDSACAFLRRMQRSDDPAWKAYHVVVIEVIPITS